jgi:hypothetical protein
MRACVTKQAENLVGHVSVPTTERYWAANSY